MGRLDQIREHLDEIAWRIGDAAFLARGAGGDNAGLVDALETLDTALADATKELRILRDNLDYERPLHV